LKKNKMTLMDYRKEFPDWNSYYKEKNIENTSCLSIE